MFHTGSVRLILLCAALGLTTLAWAQTPQLSLDADGWTTFTPSADTRVIYVSNSGSDTNDGLSPDNAVASIAKGMSLIRNGSADWLLLESGGVWHTTIDWRLSGRSPSEPILISSYGEGERPIIAAGSGDAFGTGRPISNLAIVGLDFYADTRDPDSPTFTGTAGGTGIRIIGDASNILIEDTVLRFFKVNVVLGETSLGPHLNNITLHRNIITDAYSTDSHSQGLYADMGGTGLVLDGNLFDHNGWNAAIPGAEQTIFNHNVYIQYTNGPATLNDNILANASSHGAQVRDGGTVTDNLFVHNPIGLLYGTSLGPAEGGLIANNIFTQGNDIGSQPRGFGLDVNPTTGPLEIVNNIFTQDVSAKTYGHGISLAAGTTSLITLRGAIFHDWDNPIVNNGSAIIDMSTIQINATGYLDPSRLVESYNASLGYSADLNAFLAEARLQNKDNWNPELSATSVNAFIRMGFGKQVQ